PLPPKRPLSSFFLFKQENHEKVKKQHPNARITQLISMMAEQWKKASIQEKQKYEGQYAEAKAKYEQELIEYQNKYGKIKSQKSKRNK
ncbi:nonhistone chromosomal protein lg, putative, partial [Ichthyophthirius multifiliis]